MQYPTQLAEVTMADIIDDAQAYNELHQDISLRNLRALSLPEKHPDFNGADCIDCGIGIPTQRLSMGKIRCVDCQHELELRNKQYKR